MAIVALAGSTACSAASSPHDRAAAEDSRLLAAVPTITGAQAASNAPVKQLRQPPSQPALVGLVTKARYWTVGRDSQDVYEELTGSVPAGLKNVGTGSAGGPSLEDNVRYATDEPASLPTRIAYAELLLAVVPTGPDTSAIGAYAQAVAQPPRPADEVVPATASVIVTATNSRGVLTRSKTLPGATATQFVRDFNSLPVSSTGQTSCPASDGSETGATMSAGGHLWRVATGCGDAFVSVTRDGKQLPTLNSSGTFIADIDRAVAVPPRAAVARRLAVVAATLQHQNGRAFDAKAAWAPHEAAAVRALTGEVVAGNRPVYAIEMQGRFVCTSCSVPQGVTAPRGSVLIDVVDAHTFRTEDFSLTNAYVSLSLIGPPFPIHI
jgi:hypothetical protein